MEIVRYASHPAGMKTNAGAVRIRMVAAMIAIAKPFVATFHLPHWSLPRRSIDAGRRRRATIDLIHSSPHLLRDIGVCEGVISERGQ